MTPWQETANALRDAAWRARRRLERGPTRPRLVHVRRAVTIDRPLTEIRDHLRDPATLDAALHHAHSSAFELVPAAPLRVAPGSVALEWTTESGDGTPDRVELEARYEAAVEVSGTTRLTPAPAGRGTEVRVDVRIVARRGRLLALPRAALEKLASYRLGVELGRAKQLLESGEIATASTGSGDGKEPEA